MKGIKRYRKARHMTRKDLGEAVGVSAVSIFRYEKGEREPSISRLKQIAAVLNVAVDMLLKEDDEPCQSGL